MQRLRAWDLMRREYPRVAQSEPFSSAISVLRASMAGQPDIDFVVVVDENGFLAGVLRMRDILAAIEKFVLRDRELMNASEPDWDKAFAKACSGCCSTPVKSYMDKRPTKVKPDDPVVMVVDHMNWGKTRWAVVEEGGQPIGVVLAADVFKEVGKQLCKEGR